MQNSRLRICEVRTKEAVVIGAMFFETKAYVVLLNNLAEAADLGPLKSLRSHHLEPEAAITIIPAGDVIGIEYIRADW